MPIYRNGITTIPTGAIAPLKPAADAVVVNTTTLNLQESIQLLLGIIRGKLK